MMPAIMSISKNKINKVLVLSRDSILIIILMKLYLKYGCKAHLSCGYSEDGVSHYIKPQKKGRPMKTIGNQIVNLSMILSILVLIPAVSVILLTLVQIENLWRINQPSKQILVSFYNAIFIASI